MMLGLIKNLLAKIIEGEFEIGKGFTGSGYLAYGGTLFRYNPETGKWENYQAEDVEWTWISKNKRLGKAKVKVPVGTLLKHVLFRKRGNVTKYYLATEEGFKEIPYKEEKETVGDWELVKMFKKCKVLEDVGVEDCVYYVVPRSRIYYGHAVAMTNDEEEATEWMDKLSDVKKILEDIKDKIAEKIGIKPTSIANMTVNKFRGEARVCAKLPYLGKDKFKEIASKYEYDYYDKCFWFNFVNEEDVQKIKEALKTINELS